MEIVKKQLFESLNIVGNDPIFIEMSNKQKYRVKRKKSSSTRKQQKEEEDDDNQEEEVLKFSFKEFFEWLPDKDFEEFFTLMRDNKFIPLVEEELLSPATKDQMEIIDETAVKNQQKVLFNSLYTLNGLVSILSNFLKTIVDQSSTGKKKKKDQQYQQQQKQLQQQIISNSLFSLLSMLHETLLSIYRIGENIINEDTIYSKDIVLKLQKIYLNISNDVSVCLEIWIKNKRPNYHELVPQTLSFLLFKSFSSGIVADITRLNEVRHGLLTLDYKSSDIESFLSTLVSCFTFPQFTKTDEGRKFLTFLFSINTSLIEQIHITVKSQLLNAKKSDRDNYAEMYFKAWKSSQNQILLKVEYFCIQNIINTAVHASDKKLFKNLFGFMHYFHNQKVCKEVDPMLLRLYEPILFRSLKVPNATVRTNATRLFIDVFPLKDNDAPQEDTDELLNKQFQMINELLFDPAISVRIAAVEGTFVLLCKFWELVPVTVSRSLLSKLINDLAFDKSSSLVRESVFKGIRILLDNSLSHSTLKILLPNLKNLIHDSSDRVRDAFADLLLFIKGISTIRFFDIVSVDSLIERMVIDYKNTNLSRKFTQLIVELYFPQDAKKWELLNNCISFIKKKKEAAFTFYSNLINFSKAIPITKFVCSLFDYLVKFTSKRTASEIPLKIDSTKKVKQPKKKKSITKEDNNEEDEKDEEEEEEEEQEEEVVEISVEDIEAVLEIVSLLLKSLSPLFEKEKFQKTKESMLKIFNDENLATIYCWFFQDIVVPEGAAIIMKIVSYFSLECFPALKELLLQNFQETDSTSANILQENLLQSLFSQGNQKNTLDIIINNIALPLEKLYEKEIDLNETQLDNSEDDDEREQDNQEDEEDEEDEILSTKRKRGARNSIKKKQKEKSNNKKISQQQEDESENSFEKICEKALVSISQLDYLFKNQNTRSKILSEVESCQDLVVTFISYMPVIKEKLLLDSNVLDSLIIEKQEEIKEEQEEEEEEEEEEESRKVNKFYLKRLSKSLLISVFTMYIKMMYHSEVFNKEFEQDSGFFNDIIEFGSKEVVPILEHFIKNYKSTNKRRRSNEIIDSDNEKDEEDEEEEDGADGKKEQFIVKNDKPFILEILEIYLFVMTENVAFGLSSSQTCLQYKDEIVRILTITKGVDIFKDIIPIISKFIYQIYNFSFIGYSELSVKSYDLLKLLFEYIDSNPIIKLQQQNQHQIFRLGDYLSLHHQKGQLDTITKLLIEQLFKEFPKHLNLSPEKDQVLDVLDNVKVLLPSNQLIVNYLSKNSNCITQISTFLNSFVHSQSMNQNSIYFTLNLISLLVNNNISTKIDISPLQSILIDFVSKLPSFVYNNEEDEEDEDEDEQDETLKQLKNKTISKIKYSNLLAISNDILNITTKDKSSMSTKQPVKEKIVKKNKSNK